MSTISRKQRKGFSLIEMMWQLVILVVVSFPMVMALNLQKQTIEKDETQARNQVLTNSLFSVVNPNDPDWYHRYAVSSTGPFVSSTTSWTTYSAPRNRRPSIYCDPANPALMAAAATTGNACYIGTSNAASGDNANRGPFFERTLAVVDNKLKVTVKLFEKPKAVDSATPFYENSRDFDMVPIRMMMAPYNPSIVEPRQVDDMGNPWFYNTGIPVGGLSNPLAANGNNWSVLLQSNCGNATSPISTATSPSVSTLASQPTPYKTYWLFSRQPTSSCDGATMEEDFNKWLVYRFWVAPGTYTVNVHFIIPGGVNVGSYCLANTANMSCSLADIALSSGDIATASDASTNLAFDVNAAAGPEFTSTGGLNTTAATTKPAVFRTSYTTSTRELWLYIKPTRPNVTASTSRIYLTGIEVMRRGQ